MTMSKKSGNYFNEKAYLERYCRKYADLKGEVMLFEINKQSKRALGLYLAGNKNSDIMSVFVSGIKKNGAADLDGRIRIGDELLEINGHILFGRSHINAAPLINCCRANVVRLLLIRNEKNLHRMAIRQSIYSNPSDIILSNAEKNEKIESISETLSSCQDSSERINEIDRLGKYKNFGQQVLQLTLCKESKGFGFVIIEGCLNNDSGIYIKSVTKNGSADKEGTLRSGDRLCEVNNKDITSAIYDEALNILRSAKLKVDLIVARDEYEENLVHTAASTFDIQSKLHHVKKNSLKKELSLLTVIEKYVPTTKPFEITSKSPTIQKKLLPDEELKLLDGLNPKFCPILSGVETNVEIWKGNHSLGISIVGGCDTKLNIIVINEVFKDSPAAKDGRLKPGDQLLEVNDVSLRESTHDNAIKLLRNLDEKIKMLVFRQQGPFIKENIYDFEDVQLNKESNHKSLGINIVGRFNNEGVSVSDIIKGGIADIDGRLQLGDQIVSINGEDTTTASQNEVVARFKSLVGKINVQVCRLKSDVMVLPSNLASCKIENDKYRKKIKEKLFFF